MSQPARFLQFLIRAIEHGQSLPGYAAALERADLKARARIIAGRLIAGRA